MAQIGGTPHSRHNAQHKILYCRSGCATVYKLYLGRQFRTLLFLSFTRKNLLAARRRGCITSMMIDDESLQKLYTWVDEIKLSRPKRNMARDFSDGVLTAEILHFYFPKLVQLHNYTPANSVQQKLYNWNTLNRKNIRLYE